ncbi:MAG TPA: hypothetical protein VFC06_02130, partial [Demequina sp.]|nr:hypothetical protein [Demequina sp.]
TASNMRAAERGWDWDIFAVPEDGVDSTRTVDQDEAARQANAGLAEMLDRSRRFAARGKQDSSEED